MGFTRQRKGDRFCDPPNSFQKFPPDEDTETFTYKYVKELVSCSFYIIRELLQDELNRTPFYREKWNVAKTMYSKNKNKFPSSLPEECHIALIAYTLDILYEGDTPLYVVFNLKCKGLTRDSDWKEFPYKSLYALLARSIHGIHNKPNIDQSVYYRGMSLISRKLSFKIGDIIYPTQFLSCSIKQEVAETFLKNPEPTLIKFEKSPIAACGIVGYSVYSDEAEILVFPWSTFKVKKIEISTSRNNIVLESVHVFDRGLPYSGEYSNNGINITN